MHAMNAMQCNECMQCKRMRVWTRNECMQCMLMLRSQCAHVVHVKLIAPRGASSFARAACCATWLMSCNDFTASHRSSSHATRSSILYFNECMPAFLMSVFSHALVCTRAACARECVLVRERACARAACAREREHVRTCSCYTHVVCMHASMCARSSMSAS